VIPSHIAPVDEEADEIDGREGPREGADEEGEEESESEDDSEVSRLLVASSICSSTDP